MIDLLAVYICPKCGEILEDQIDSVECIDDEHDDVWIEKVCQKCGHDVTRKMVDGVQCFEQVDHQRWLWATGAFDIRSDE